MRETKKFILINMPFGFSLKQDLKMKTIIEINLFLWAWQI